MQSTSGMLAHLRDQFRVPPEDLATEALAYILNESPRAHTAANEFFQIPGAIRAPVRYVTQVTDPEDAARPDLVGLDDMGSPSVVVEAKFDAALTSHQPTTYIERLRKYEGRRLLAFLVPGRRRAYIWHQIQGRCATAAVALGPTEESGGFQWAQAGEVTVALTTWAEVLNTLEARLLGDDDRQTLWDVRQLRAMCERQDRDGFRPLTTDELSPMRGQRIVDFVDLIWEVVEQVLRAEGLADTRGLNRSHSTSYVGRYFKLVGWECLLHINWLRWATQRATPMWLEVTDRRAAGYRPLLEALSPLALAQPSRLLTGDGKIQIPLFLPEDVERDEVIERLSVEIREIAGLLRAVPPIGAAEAP